MELFKGASDRPEETRKNVEYALSLRPIIEFWIKDFSDSAPTTGGCAGMPIALRDKRKALVAAVEAVESYGSALTSGPFDQTSDLRSLEALTKVAHAF